MIYEKTLSANFCYKFLHGCSTLRYSSFFTVSYFLKGFWHTYRHKHFKKHFIKFLRRWTPFFVSINRINFFSTCLARHPLPYSPYLLFLFHTMNFSSQNTTQATPQNNQKIKLRLLKPTKAFFLIFETRSTTRQWTFEDSSHLYNNKIARHYLLRISSLPTSDSYGTRFWGMKNLLYLLLNIHKIFVILYSQKVTWYCTLLRLWLICVSQYRL